MSEHSPRFEAAYRYRQQVARAINQYRAGIRLAWKHCPVLDHSHLKQGMEWEWRILQHRFAKYGRELDRVPVILDMEIYTAIKDWLTQPISTRDRAH